jgi:hypothetical protein
MAQIVVNGQRIDYLGALLSYDGVVRLVRMGAALPPETKTVYSITYRGAAGEKAEGSLLPGQSVTVKDGMTISAFVTGNA